MGGDKWSAPVPENEERRLAELYTYELLDTPAEAAFDRLTHALCHALDVPIATITLVDRNRQWVKSARGLDLAEAAPQPPFCGHVVYHNAPLLIEDTRRDERFREHPLVTGPPYLRFYAGMPLTSANGLPLGAVCALDTRPRRLTAEGLACHEDIAHAVSELAEIRRLEGFLERERRLFAAGPTVIFRWGAEPGWPMQYASASLAEVFGYQPEALLGTAFTELVHPTDRPRVEQELATDIERGATRYKPEPYRLRHADGSYRWVQDVRLIEWDESGQWLGLYGYLNDITERVELEAQLDQHRFYDTRTGLPNRALFEERLDRAVREHHTRQGGLAVIALDLADFHAINDSLGHAGGDAVLQAVGERLSRLVGPTDTVARLSGDEFGLLVHRLDGVEAAIHLAERIVETVAAPYKTTGVDIPINVRTGLRLCPDGPCSTKTLLEQADAALNQAKSEGASYRFFSEELTGQARQRLELVADLRQALAEEEQLAVHYQPQIDLYTGHWAGVEALVRWRHPQRGWISPATFIPAAERAGLIEWLGHWVLEQACAQGRAWLAQGVAFGRVAVNVAVPQLHDDRFVEQVLSTLTKTQLPANYLEIELTESLMVAPNGPVIERLETLRRYGVRVTVDDFGTGYSALSYLKDLPIDRIKIDRSFVQGLPKECRMLAVTRAILALGHSLQHTIIAEGIEDEHERTALLAEGCRYGQGYLLAQPAPPGALPSGPRGRSGGHPRPRRWRAAQPSGFPLPERAS